MTLNKLPLILKQSFQFLYSFSLSLENKIMLPIWQSLQVANTIISRYSIEMMYYPALRQLPIVSCFPNNQMFSYIPSSISSWVVRYMKENITSLTDIPTPLPLRVFLAHLKFPSTFSTTGRDFPTRLATINTVSHYIGPDCNILSSFGMFIITSLIPSTLGTNRNWRPYVPISNSHGN